MEKDPFHPKTPESPVSHEKNEVVQITTKLRSLLYDWTPETLPEAVEFFQSLNSDFKKLPEVKECIISEFTNAILGYGGRIDKGKNFADIFELSEYERNNAIVNKLLTNGGSFYGDNKIDYMLHVRDAFKVQNEVFQESIYRKIKAYPSIHSKEDINRLSKEFGFDKEKLKIIFSDMTHQIIDNFSNPPRKDYFERYHSNEFGSDLRRFSLSIDNFNVPKEVYYPATLSMISTSLIKKPEKEWIIEDILKDINIPRELLKNPKISEPRFNNLIKHIEEWHKDLHRVEGIILDLNDKSKLIPLPDDFYYRDQMRKWIEISISALLDGSFKYDIDTLAESVVPREIVSKAIAMKMIEKRTEKHPLNDDMRELLERIPISLEIKKEAAKDMTIKALTTADTNTLDYIQKYVVPFQQAEIQLFCRDAFSKTDDFSHKKILNEYVGGTLDPILNKTVQLFGGFANESNYNLLVSLDKGILDDDAKSFGISKTGQEGIVQLENRLRDFKGEILDENFDIKILQESLIARDFFKSYIRYEESDFGDRSDEAFSSIIESYKQNKERGVQERLNPNFTSSGEVKVDSIDKNAQENFKWGEHFMPRYSVLVEDLQKALILDKERFPITRLIEALEEKRKTVLLELTQKVQKMENEKGAPILKERIKKLEVVNLRSLKDFQSNFLTLSSFKEFHEDLRKTMFLWSVAKNRPNLNEELSRIQSQHPSVNDVSNVIDFIDHITNQETMAKYFTDKQAKTAFEKITSTIALQEELVRAQNQGIKGTKSLEFIPTRGLLMEFSGHISDACWASQRSIAKDFPNFTSTIFVQNRNTKLERIAGAALLIEAKSKNGDDLLIIRGLNPLQNIINELSVDDFYKKYTGYLKPVAEKMGRKLAIVIDDHCGGSSTNRPILFNYLQGRELKKIILDSNERTEFNDYDITYDCFLVE